MAQVAELNRRMTSLDASFLYLEQPNALLHVAGIYTFARLLDYERLVRDVRERLPLIPRYMQRAVMVPLNLGHPTWEPDPDFDIRAHLKRHTLRGHGDDVALAALCAKLFAQPLDRGMPLWEMHLIDGYRDHGSAVLAKTHHCMIDGASGVELISILMDATPQPIRIAPPRRSAHRPALPNPLAQIANGLLDTVRTQFDIGRRVVGMLRQPARAIAEARQTVDAIRTMSRTLLAGAPPTPFNGAISDQRALAWASFSLHEVKAIKNRLGGTVNDVVLAMISGGLRHYLRDLGHKIDRTELKAMVPVNIRGEHEHLKLGNRVSMMVAPLVIGINDPVERLRQVSAAMDQLKSSGQAAQMERVVALTDLLPPPLQRPLARLQASVQPVNTVCTNVPGPRETRYFLGEPVQTMLALVPLAVGIGIGFAIMSYADKLAIGINADAERVPDAWPVAKALHRSFDELWAATGLERLVQPPTVEPALTRRQRQTPAQHGGDHGQPDPASATA